LLLALAVTAISAQFEDEAALVDDSSIDEFLETESEMSLPCTPKPCVPVCKLVTKYVTYGSFKMEYKENECKPDHKCLAAAAACQKKLMAAMIDADKKAKALEAASKAKNAAHASHAAKVKAANAKKAEAAAAKNSMGLAKAAFVAAEKDAANAKAAKESATKLYAAKAKVMDARLKDYEKAMQAHKNAVAAYDGAKSAAAKAAAAYEAAVKAHCDAEAQHAAAVKNIGHGHLAQKKCAKYSTPTTVGALKCFFAYWDHGTCGPYGEDPADKCLSAGHGGSFALKPWGPGYAAGRVAKVGYVTKTKCCASGKAQVVDVWTSKCFIKAMNYQCCPTSGCGKPQASACKRDLKMNPVRG